MIEWLHHEAVWFNFSAHPPSVFHRHPIGKPLRGIRASCLISIVLNILMGWWPIRSAAHRSLGTCKSGSSWN